MIVQGSALPPTTECDVCIVGSGPAAISVALKTSKRFTKVFLLEAGDDHYTMRSQSAYRGEVIGDPYFPLDQCRLRYFGGTSNHWNGHCRPLDAVDFEAKPYCSSPGWPIGKRDLDIYLDEALSVLELPFFPADQPLGKSKLSEIWFDFSTVRFAQKYRSWIEASDRITLSLDAPVTSLETDGESVTAVNVRAGSTEKQIRARYYVIATGGIENSRLLLWSQRLSGGGLIKQDWPLGRFWMEHPQFTLGDAILPAQPAFTPVKEGQRAFLSPTPQAMWDDRSLNCCLKLSVLPYRDTHALIADIACLAPDFGRRAARLLNKDLMCGSVLRAAWEEEPKADNRIELAEETDATGVPRVKLFWKKSVFDIATARSTALRFGRYLATTGEGRVRLRDWVVEDGPFPERDILAGNHHMGGTRMADDAKSGVVDRNCRVFGQRNLYIAGSSVFPSGGHANPTLTIVQLALRLGEHIANT